MYTIFFCFLSLMENIITQNMFRVPCSMLRFLNILLKTVFFIWISLRGLNIYFFIGWVGAVCVLYRGCIIVMAFFNFASSEISYLRTHSLTASDQKGVTSRKNAESIHITRLYRDYLIQLVCVCMRRDL